MGEPLIKVVKFFLDDKTRGSKGAKEFDLEVYFNQQDKAICSNKPQLVESLQLLQNDPSKDYRLYIHVFRKIISVSNPDKVEQFNQVKEQMNHLLLENLLMQEAHGATLTLLSHCMKEFADFCKKAKKPTSAIEPLFRCIRLTSLTKLSTFRTYFAEISFQNYFWQHSLEVIENDLIDVLPSTPATDVVNYYWYSGLIFQELKRYAEAFRAFERVLVPPTKQVTTVHIAAFQRLVLLAIILGHDEYQLPHHSQDLLKHDLKLGDGQIQTENIRNSAINFTIYEQLVNSAKTKQSSEMIITIEKYEKLFNQHETLQLAHIAAKTVQERQVKNLGDVYLKLGFSEIFQKASLDPQIGIEKFVVKLINERFLLAQVNQETQTVEFQEDTDTLDLIDTLENQNKKIADLMRFANDLDVSIKTDPEFIDKKIKEKAKNNMQVDQQEQQNFN